MQEPAQTWVDRDTAVPLYHQIFLQLRDEILSGERPHGSAMPTEQDVSAMFSVSRITARRALTELADQHFVERRRRLGTRVTFRSPAKPIEANIDKAIDSLVTFGRGSAVKVLDVLEENPSPSIASALALEPGERVVRAVRVRSLDGVPLGYVVSYVPARLGSIVTAQALQETPILRVLADAGFKAVHAEQTIGALIADSTMAQALEIEARSALLRITRTVRDAQNIPFLITFAHYRSDRFNIRLDLQG